MKKLVAVAMFVCLAVLSGIAQEKSKVQVYGGYQYTNADFANLADRQSFNGWDSDVAVKVTKHFSAVGDVSGTYKSLKDLSKSLGAPTELTSLNPRASMYSFLAGPRYTVAPMGRFTPFAQVLLGVDHLAVTADNVGGLSIGKSSFALAAGVGADYNVNKHFSYRLVKADYMLQHFAGDSSLVDVHIDDNLNHFRIATGVIYKF